MHCSHSYPKQIYPDQKLFCTKIIIGMTYPSIGLINLHLTDFDEIWGYKINFIGII